MLTKWKRTDAHGSRTTRKSSNIHQEATENNIPASLNVIRESIRGIERPRTQEECQEIIVNQGHMITV